MSDTPPDDRQRDESSEPVESVNDSGYAPPTDDVAAGPSGQPAAAAESPAGMLGTARSPIYERPAPGRSALEEAATPGAEAAAERMIARARAESAARETFADLTLWEVLLRGVRAPRVTWKAFWAVVNADDVLSVAAVEAPSLSVPATSMDADRAADSGLAGSGLREDVAAVAQRLRGREAVVPVGLMILGFALALLGSSILASGTSRAELRELNTGAPWLIVGFGMWVAAGVAVYGYDLLAWLRRWGDRLARRRQASGTDGGEDVHDLTAPLAESLPATAGRPAGLSGFWTLLEVHAARLVLAGLGVVLCLATYAFNGNNAFTGFGIFLWISSIVVWLAVLTPTSFDLVTWAEQWRARWTRLFRRDVNFNVSWTAVALIAIMLVAGYFRFAELAGVPPEMTSDHVEKLLDAQRVLDGTYQIFFPNNGGREGLQMYLVAIFSQVSGLGMQFATLKWVSVLEGLLTIPVLWWMGRALIGERQPRLGNAVGLILAALVAVSYWHVSLSRLALRIVLTPLVMAVVMVYLARAMRHNHRSDFLKAGLALGIGLYCYQAARMIPVVIVLGVGLAFLFRARTWVERRRYVGNLAALVLVAVVIFVPLGRFMIESPNHFWMRTAGRILGDDVITETDPDTGAIIERNATLQDRIDAFSANLPVLGNNIRNVFLMFNWKGDVAWINGVPNAPAMDVITGSLLILGLAAWLVRMFRWRDLVDWLVLPAIFIMLLPSALSIAFPVENPSATRTSGALPLVYLIAAYALAWLLQRVEAVVRNRRMRLVSTGLAVVLVLGAFSDNSALYFGQYVDHYRIAAQPYGVAGRVLKGFAESNGSYGNAFMVAYDYWFDHRAIGIVGGRIGWPNGLLSLDDWPQFIRDSLGTEYAFDPDRAVLFFYNRADEATPQQLHDWFPNGSSILQSTDIEVKDFYTFTTPPPGEAWLTRFLAEHLPAAD